MSLIILTLATFGRWRNQCNGKPAKCTNVLQCYSISFLSCINWRMTESRNRLHNLFWECGRGCGCETVHSKLCWWVHMSWGRERDLFQVITLSKYVLKIIVHYSLLDSRSNMVITDLLPGAPWMFLLAVLCFFSSSLSFLMALHPVYISVWEQLE